MLDNQLEQRRKLYFDLSSQIALLNNEQMRALFGPSGDDASYGTNHTITIGRSKVFVKRVPVTDLEYENMFSTRNVYDLPTFYNYGFGSAGMGVFRELAAHVKTTNWVLSGAIANFPLMYHYRLVPFTGEHEAVDMEYHPRYVKYWGGSENVGRYMLDRASAKYELVLFLEYFPQTVAAWLKENQSKLPLVLAEMHSTLSFLRKYGVLHMDAHFNNMVTEGKHAYLTDFGLVLDKQFDLSPAEKEFYRQNSYYDFGYLLWILGTPLFWAYRNLSEDAKARLLEQFGFKEGVAFEDIVAVLLEKREQLASSGIMQLDKEFVATLVKYEQVSIFMNDFYRKMRMNNAKDDRFDNAKLRRLLTKAGFMPAANSAKS